jgi:hypothetical protein
LDGGIVKRLGKISIGPEAAHGDPARQQRRAEERGRVGRDCGGRCAVTDQFVQAVHRPAGGQQQGRVLHPDGGPFDGPPTTAHRRQQIGGDYARRQSPALIAREARKYQPQGRAEGGVGGKQKQHRPEIPPTHSMPNHQRPASMATPT